MWAQVNRVTPVLLAACIVFIVIAPPLDLPSTVKTQPRPTLPCAALIVEFVLTLVLAGSTFRHSSMLQRCGSRLEVGDLTCARLC